MRRLHPRPGRPGEDPRRARLRSVPLQRDAGGPHRLLGLRQGRRREDRGQFGGGQGVQRPLRVLRSLLHSRRARQDRRHEGVRPFRQHRQREDRLRFQHLPVPRDRRIRELRNRRGRLRPRGPGVPERQGPDGRAGRGWIQGARRCARPRIRQGASIRIPAEELLPVDPLQDHGLRRDGVEELPGHGGPRVHRGERLRGRHRQHRQDRVLRGGALDGIGLRADILGGREGILQAVHRELLGVRERIRGRRLCGRGLRGHHGAVRRQFPGGRAPDRIQEPALRRPALGRHLQRGRPPPRHLRRIHRIHHLGHPDGIQRQRRRVLRPGVPRGHREQLRRRHQLSHRRGPLGQQLLCGNSVHLRRLRDRSGQRVQGGPHRIPHVRGRARAIPKGYLRARAWSEP